MRPIFLSLVFVSLFPWPALAEETTLYRIPTDLSLPAVVDEEPAAGKRVRMTTAPWKGTSVYHALYLPVDWTAETRRLPVIVEYPGNGAYRNRYDDVSHGTIECCALGYGLTAGKGAIWISLPFLAEQDGFQQNATLWWGEIEESKRYCTATLREVCARFGGDPERVLLAGFSRGAIACFYIGLHDDEIARLWCGFFCHSHLDGLRENWPYPNADRASALERLRRLGNRPVWISSEGGTSVTERYLKETGVAGDFTFEPLPYPNHSVGWMLRDLPLRAKARAWWEDHIVAPKYSNVPNSFPPSP